MFDGSKTNDVGETMGTADAMPRWKRIDRELRTIAKQRGALDRDEAILLCEAARHEVWRRVGNASLFEYLEEVLGYGPKTARERIRIATALEEMPELATALASGELSYSAVRELTRVATKETEREWIDAVRGKNLRQVEELVAKRQKGDRPSDPEDPSLAPRVVSFKIRPATLELLRQVQRQLADEHGGQLEDDALIEALCNAVLASSEAGDHSRAKFQIRATICSSCERGAPLDRIDVQRANCDAQRIGSDQRAKQDIPPKTRRFVFHRDGGTCVVPGCRAKRFLDVHHIVARADGGGHEAENLAVMCSLHHRELHAGAFAIAGPASKLEVTSHAPHVGHRSELEAMTVEAKQALTQAGYPRLVASRMVERAMPAATLEDLIRAALREKP